MACCGTVATVVIVLVASLFAFIYDIRPAEVKGDSILFVKQSFDERFEIPSVGRKPSRVCYFDLPDNHTKGLRPIIFLIHGKSSNADDMKTLFGPESIKSAKMKGFLVVYPVGMINDDGSRTWNAGSVDAHNTEEDVEYFSEIVSHLTKNFHADSRSVFLSGMSNGGFMTHRLACAWASSSHGIKVRAIVPTLGGLAKMKYDKNCGGDAHKLGSVPIPVIRVFDQDKCPYSAWKAAPAHFECNIKNIPAMIVNNGQDALVPLSGVTITGDGELYPPVEYTLQFYSEANGCNYTSRTHSFHQVSPADTEDVTTCHSLQGCRVNTTLCVSQKSGHNWVMPFNGEYPAMPSGFFKWLMGPYATSMDTSHEVLNFFSQHR